MFCARSWPYHQEMRSERGSAMLVTMILITALFSGAAVMANMQLQSNRASSTSRTKNSALYCAEAGLPTARSAVVANYTSWNTALQSGGTASWLTSLNRDIDGDGQADFTVTIKDNEDETGTDDPTQDNDLTVYVVSTCTKYADVRTSVAELVRISGGGSCYQSQFGGCGGNGNGN